MDRENRCDAGEADAGLVELESPEDGPAARAVPVLLCLLSVVLADLFFWKAPLGWTVGGYGLFLLGAILVSARRFPRGRPARVIAPALVLLFLAAFEEPNPLVILLGFVGLVTFAFVAREGWVADGPAWIRRWLRFLVEGWLCLFRDARAWQRGRGAAPGGVRGFLRNWSLAVVLGAVFAGLFALANPVIARWFTDVWNALPDLFRKLPPVERVLMWLIVGVLVWALLRYRSRLVVQPAGTSPEWPAAAKEHLSVGVLVRCLLLFNVIFAFQTVLDVCYLYGGAQLPKGMTYAYYAHRGAYPLVATALLAAAFVLAAFRAGPRADGASWARRLVYVWLAQNVFLVFSAGWRLRLYVSAYALTRWRVAAAVWMLLVVLGLLWILLRIVWGRSNLWLVNVNMLTAAVVLYACAFVGFDGLIARFNVTHCAEVRGDGPAIDLPYLQRLGPESLPAIGWLAGRLEDPQKADLARQSAERLALKLRADLDNWRGWTFRRQRLSRATLPPAETGSPSALASHRPASD